MRKLILILALAQIACLQTTIASTAEKSDGTSAPSAVPAAFLSQEPESGAVIDLASLQTPIPDPRKCATVTAIEALHLRTEPSEKAVVIGWLKAGQVVTVRIQEPDWWMVEAEGRTGYARAAYLKESECE